MNGRNPHRIFFINNKTTAQKIIHKALESNHSNTNMTFTDKVLWRQNYWGRITWEACIGQRCSEYHKPMNYHHRKFQNYWTEHQKWMLKSAITPSLEYALRTSHSAIDVTWNFACWPMSARPVDWTVILAYTLIHWVGEMPIQREWSYADWD